MRELAKSAISFSWALSLLSVEQAVNLVRPGANAKQDVFGPITQAAVNQLDDSLKDMYRFGENVQKRMLDATFGWMNPSTFTNLSKWFSRPFEAGDKTSPEETVETTHADQHNDQQHSPAGESCCG